MGTKLKEERQIKLSYAVTVCNEVEEIKHLLTRLLQHKRSEDEIVVLMDATKATDELISTLRHYERHYMDDMTVWADNFEGHFANWKNKLTSYCTGDYIFQIDADELITQDLMVMLPQLLELNDIDVVRVPRVNTVTGLTQDHIQKWGWHVDVRGWINFPDYQMRIYRNDKRVKWINKVHEVLWDYTTVAELPADPEYALIHHKSIERQEKQNNYYSTL